MAVFKTLEEWAEKQGEVVSDYLQDSADAIGAFICNLRAKYPNSFFGSGFGRGLANSICSGVLGNDPIGEGESPYQGGQCEGILYNVTIVFDRYRTNGELLSTGNQVFIGQYLGAITNVSTAVVDSVNNPGLTESRYFITYKDSQGNEVNGGSILGGDGLKDILTDVLFARVDGQADNCGNPPPQLPPDPARDSSDFSTTVTVCDYDEQGNPINCEDFEVRLDEKDKYDFPICVVVDGKKICLDADGWSIEDAPVADEKKEEEEEEFEEIEVLDWVLVTVNQLPTKFNKRIVRSDSKDSEIFAGYLAWGYVREGIEYFLPAIPIRKERNAFKPPEGIENYSVYYNFELTGSITEIKKTIKVPKQPVEPPV